jgi:cytochrome c553
MALDAIIAGKTLVHPALRPVRPLLTEPRRSGRANRKESQERSMRHAILFGGVLFLAAAPAFADDIERTWKAKCGSCHGNDGKAQTEKGKKEGVADMTTPDWQKKMTDAQIKEAIEKGVKKEEGGKTKRMEGYAGKLKPEQIDELVKFIRKLGGK